VRNLLIATTVGLAWLCVGGPLVAVLAVPLVTPVAIMFLPRRPA
jgi:hypothetical protein